MKNRIILILSLVALIFLLVGPVWAATTGTINVTVTPTLISLSVDPTAYNYGVLGTGETAETTITFDVQNDGNVDADFDIRGYDDDWKLVAAVGALNEYRHDWKEATSGTYAPLTTDGDVAATSVGSGDSESFRFYLYTPTPSDVTAAQNPDVMFTASASGP